MHWLKRLLKWTLSALQLHPWALIVVDEDATSGTLLPFSSIYATDLSHIRIHPLELHVKTVKYFKSIEFVQDEVERTQHELKLRGKITEEQIGSME